MRLEGVILLILCLIEVNAQECDGFLGENIFTDGDFGSGVAPIVLDDPEIAPGYTYETIPPPNDGYYTITNSTIGWSDIRGWPWAGIQDNSPDPNGYMMVVNASFDPGLFYEKTIDNLCENTRYQFSADIFNMINAGEAIKPNVTFVLDGQELFTTGEIPQDVSWHSYQFTFETAPNQTSMTLGLRNNSPGGIGNDLAIDNIAFQACGPEARIGPEGVSYVCRESSTIALEANLMGGQFDSPQIQWQKSVDGGISWENIVGETNDTLIHSDSDTGRYYYRYLIANSIANLENAFCRVASNVKIVEVLPNQSYVRDTICEGSSYNFFDQELTRSGRYSDTMISSFGCEVEVILDLVFIPNDEIEYEVSTVPPSCSNTRDGKIILSDINSSYPPNVVSIDNGPIMSDTLDGIGTGVYRLEVTNRFGCGVSEEVELISPDPFEIEINGIQRIELGERLILNVSSDANIQDYIWNPSDIISCELDCSTVEFLPTENTIVSVLAINEQGCEERDSILIEVEKVRQLFIPNIFSPNNDGVNDHFVIYGATPNVLNIQEFHVFDRWGGQVYSVQNIPPNEENFGWDGSANGQILAPGVYTYSAKVEFLDREVISYSGTVTLIQ